MTYTDVVGADLYLGIGEGTMSLSRRELEERLRQMPAGAQSGLVFYQIYVVRKKSGYEVLDPLAHRALRFKDPDETARFVLSRVLTINQLQQRSA
jgi:hypothetical protein